MNVDGRHMGRSKLYKYKALIYATQHKTGKIYKIESSFVVVVYVVGTATVSVHG